MPSVDRICFAHGSSDAASLGWHTNTLRRLGESPFAEAEYGPPIDTNSTAGLPW